MTPDDAVATAVIHARELPHGFFVDLGPRFLAAYHRSFVESPHAVATVATLDGRVAGFLVGTLRTRPHYRCVLRRSAWRMVLWALVGAVRNPRALVELLLHRWRRYVRSVRRHLTGSGRRDVSPVARPRRVAVLTHVAVLAGARGRRLGAELVTDFEDQVRAAGVPEIRLVTLAGEEGARAFYEHLGWERFRERRGADGLPVVEFRRTT